MAITTITGAIIFFVIMAIFWIIGEAMKSDKDRFKEIFTKDLNVVVYHLEEIDKELKKEQSKKENIQSHAERLTEYINTELLKKVQAFNLPMAQKPDQEKVVDMLKMIVEGVRDFKDNIITSDTTVKYRLKVQEALLQLGR